MVGNVSPYTIEIRYWVDPASKQRYAQYRMRGANSLAWIPLGVTIAKLAIDNGRFLGCHVEHVADVVRGAA